MTWKNLLEFVREHEAAFGVLIGALGVATALASAGVSLLQTSMLMNERATPYRTAVYVAQLEVTRNIAASAADYWEAEAQMLRACKGLSASGTGQGWEESFSASTERAAAAFYAFRRASTEGYAVLPDAVSVTVEQLYLKIDEGAARFGNKTCAESAQDLNWHAENDADFFNRYHAFVQAARADAKIDTLSSRPAILTDSAR